MPRVCCAHSSECSKLLTKPLLINRQLLCYLPAAARVRATGTDFTRIGSTALRTGLVAASYGRCFHHACWGKAPLPSTTGCPSSGVVSSKCR